MDFTAEENQEMRQWREEADREDDRECELARINALQTIGPRPEGMGPVLQGQFEDIGSSRAVSRRGRVRGQFETSLRDSSRQFEGQFEEDRQFEGRSGSNS